MILRIRKAALRRKAENDEIRALIKRFLDGESSLLEEKVLYKYFQRGTVAKEFEPYGEMFRWYSGLDGGRDGKHRHPGAKRWLVAAATVAALVGCGVGLTHYLQAANEPLSLRAQYAGSYIIRNGEKITDFDAILPELLRVERYADSAMAEAREVNVDECERAIIEAALKNVDDTEMRAIIMANI